MIFINMINSQFNREVVFIVTAGILLSVSLYYSQMLIPPSILASSSQSVNLTSSPSVNNSSSASGASVSVDIPTARSVFETGTLSLPSSVKGFIISLPDETHELDTLNKTISHKNAHYLPSNLIIPSGSSIAFVHGDPNHIHVEVVRDNSAGGNLAWQTIPITHPGSSDIKVLPSPGLYTISDPKYPAMKGTITVDKNVQSNGNLVVGGFFCPTPLLASCKSNFASNNFKVLSQYSFLSKTKQKDISGPTTLLIYSTTLPMQDALTKLKPMLASLPYL
jgi:plastocyanin